MCAVTDTTHLLEQMLRQIEFYRNGDMGLGDLVVVLELLNDSITSQSITWKRSLFDKIGDLEQANAVMLDQGMEVLDETGRMIVDKALNELVIQVKEARGV